MHYYQFNIGDYAKSTMHLSMIEDLAYRRLLDLYYDTEKPLEPDVKKLCRLIRLSSHENETQQILSEFFNLTKKGWIQKRVQKELTAYSRKATAARDNGKKGGRPKKTQLVNLANPELTQSKAKQEPLNINHKPLSNKPLSASPQWCDEYMAEFWIAYPKRVDKKKTLVRLKAMITKNPDVKHWQHVLNCINEKARVTETQFFPSPDRYLRDEKWNDELVTTGASQNGSYRQTNQRKTKLEIVRDQADSIISEAFTH